GNRPRGRGSFFLKKPPGTLAERPDPQCRNVIGRGEKILSPDPTYPCKFALSVISVAKAVDLPPFSGPITISISMSITFVLASALLVAQQPAGAQLPESPIKRIEVTPRVRTIVAGDSMRLQARALDANGQPVPGAVIHFTMRGGQGEGSIDSTGF